MVGSLEVRVREQKEQLSELALLEEVGQVLHGVGADAADVLVLPWVLTPGTCTRPLFQLKASTFCGIRWVF
jgi:hypothetical protein